MLPSFKSILALSFLALSIGTLRAATPEESFAAANVLYEKGEYAKAADAYAALITNGSGSPDVLFNLGNALHKTGKRGEAALAWRRALSINPQHVESRQNLGFLGRKTGFLDYENDRTDFGDFLPANSWYVALTTGAWILVLSIASLLFFRLRGTTFAIPVILSTLALSAIGVSIFAVISAEKRMPADNLAVITAEETKAYTEPASTAETVISLPPGSEVKVLLVRESWSYVDIPGELRGWVPTESVERLHS